LPQPLLSWRDHPQRLSRQNPRYARIAFDNLRAAYLSADPRLIAARERLVLWGAGRRTRQRAAHLLDQRFQAHCVDRYRPAQARQSHRWRTRAAAGMAAQRRPKPLVLAYVASHGARPCIEAELARMHYRKGIDYLHVG
jgi:hypothetical protein